LFLFLSLEICNTCSWILLSSLSSLLSNP
jgi:hypothetical protein